MNHSESIDRISFVRDENGFVVPESMPDPEEKEDYLFASVVARKWSSWNKQETFACQGGELLQAHYQGDPHDNRPGDCRCLTRET